MLRAQVAGARALEGDVAPQAQVVGPVDRGGPPEGDQLVDAVAAHGLGDLGLGGVGLDHGGGSSRVRSLQGFPVPPGA